MEKLDEEKLGAQSKLDADRESRAESLEAPSRSSVYRARSTSIARTRSNNGHGVADLEEDPSADDTLAPNRPDGEKDPFEVAWDGDDDPLCPRSMSKPRRWMAVIVVGMGSFCVTCTSSIYASMYGQMNPELHMSSIVGTLGLSLFVLGIALGPLLMSPLSEFVGRRPIYLASWGMFLIWLIPSAVARNAETMLVARFIDGFAGSSFLSVAGGTVSDMFKRHEIQGPMVIMSLSPFVGPSFGPLFGGFINYNTSWRWTYYVLIIWAFFLYMMIIFFAPETYHPIKLRDKARLLRKETGDERWRAPMEKSTKSVVETIGYSLLRPFQLLLFEPMCLLLCLFSALLLGVLYLFFGAFPLVFGQNYGFNLWQNGLSFLGIFVGMILYSLTDPLWRRIYLRLIAQNNGAPEPEFRLPPAIAGAFLCPIGLFIFAWTAFPWVHWIVPIIGSGIFGCGTLMVFTGIFTFLVDAYPHFAASAMAANSFTRCVFAAAFPLFGIQMYHKLGFQWGSSLLAFLTVAMLPFPYLFFRYGKQIRKNSRFSQ
ncbi:MFS general substrate transporter [Durotheca rogersii]|uniref:MFS general substrate transporter n=1 Tax=Durotheca rogersii TaxID=419775 RepID=UPI00221FEC3A|nr:MFS general substrate transporter [Durotheca rogersii]KAI5864176.1 MFS general substrate transporter [Durotheca rogersii]